MQNPRCNPFPANPCKPPRLVFKISLLSILYAKEWILCSLHNNLYPSLNFARSPSLPASCCSLGHKKIMDTQIFHWWHGWMYAQMDKVTEKCVRFHYNLSYLWSNENAFYFEMESTVELAQERGENFKKIRVNGWS